MEIYVIKTQDFDITTPPKVKWAKRDPLLVPSSKSQTSPFYLP